jgi:hypothetical protein
VRLVKFVGQRAQAVTATGNQNESRTPLRKRTRKVGTKTRARARD